MGALLIAKKPATPPPTTSRNFLTPEDQCGKEGGCSPGPDIFDPCHKRGDCNFPKPNEQGSLWKYDNVIGAEKGDGKGVPETPNREGKLTIEGKAGLNPLPNAEITVTYETPAPGCDLVIPKNDKQ